MNDDAARRLVGLRADQGMQDRIEAFADRNSEGVITPDERAEYERLVTAAMLINVLQAKARAHLAHKPTAA